TIPPPKPSQTMNNRSDFGERLVHKSPKTNDKSNEHMKTIRHIIYPAFSVVALACFALAATAQAVTPAPDGGYPNANTAEGTGALFYSETGDNNTATGYEALFNNIAGNNNVATGYGALLNNTTGYNNTALGFQALYSNTGDTAFNNTATGSSALQSNTSGN